MSGFIYLASPYSHPEMSVRVERFMAAQAFCVWAFKNNYPIYSPIVHWHHIAAQYELDYKAEYWLVQNEATLEAASQVWALAIPGWKESNGVRLELLAAEQRKVPIRIVTPLEGGEYSLEFSE